MVNPIWRITSASYGPIHTQLENWYFFEVADYEIFLEIRKYIWTNVIHEVIRFKLENWIVFWRSLLTKYLSKFDNSKWRFQGGRREVLVILCELGIFGGSKIAVELHTSNYFKQVKSGIFRNHEIWKLVITDPICRTSIDNNSVGSHMSGYIFTVKYF